MPSRRAASDWRTALFALGACLALPACGSQQVCDIDELMNRELADAESADCGTYAIVVEESPDAHPELEEAHACVQAAIDAVEPFRVLWRFEGFEGTATSGYLSLGGSAPDVIRFDQGTGGTSRMDCDTLAPMDFCDPSLLRSFLCFECVGAADSQTICDS